MYVSYQNTNDYYRSNSFVDHVFMTTIFIRTYARVAMVLCGEKSDNVCTHFVTIIQRLSVAYIGPKSRTERPRKTKIGTEVNWHRGHT